MHAILQDMSLNRINDAIEGNLFALLPILSMMGNLYHDNPPGLKRSISDVRMPLFNSIMDARLDEKIVDSAIQCVIADGQTRRVPLLWWLGPSTRPLDLNVKLEYYGFKLNEDAPGMAIDLHKLVIEQDAPQGLTVQLAHDETSWRQWSDTMAAGFEAPPDATFIVNVWAKFLSCTNPETVKPYIGWLQGRPVAVALLNLAVGVAGIYSVATIPAARKMGIGRYMTQYPLQQALSWGYKIGVLEASEMGHPVYRSLGFKEYCKIQSYRWDPEKN